MFRELVSGLIVNPLAVGSDVITPAKPVIVIYDASMLIIRTFIQRISGLVIRIRSIVQWILIVGVLPLKISGSDLLLLFKCGILHGFGMLSLGCHFFLVGIKSGKPLVEVCAGSCNPRLETSELDLQLVPPLMFDRNG